MKTEKTITPIELKNRFDSIYSELLPQVEDMQNCCQRLQRQVISSGVSEFQEDINAIDIAIANLHRAVDVLQDATLHNQFNNSPNTTELESRLRHDLRTPLNAVKGYSEMLLDDPQCAESRSIHSLLSTLLLQTDQILESISQKVVIREWDTDSAIKIPQSQRSTALVQSNPITETGRILVVDDGESNRRLLERSLSQQGHDVECAADGRSALTQLHQKDFDLVLLDMLMPGMDGLEVLSIIKSDTKLQHIPVIVISALDDFDRVIECIKGGAEDYLPKPFNATLLAARIGTGLEKKRLRDTTTALLNRMEAELQDANHAQLNLVPHESIDLTLECPVALQAYMKPAREVGGDFYDYFFMDRQYLWFMVGDVSDKGVASGMFMARAISLIRSISTQAYNQVGKVLMPHEVLNQLNSELCRFNPDMTFVTLLIGRLDIESGEVLFGNAGHSAALLLAEVNVVESMETVRGRPIGIRPDSVYESHVSNLHGSQSLFIYTDGVSDALDMNGHRLGESQLVDTLNQLNDRSAESILDAINLTLENHTTGTDQFDDITMVALQWEGKNFSIVKEISIANTLSDCSVARKEIAAALVTNGVEESAVQDLSICTDELLSNIVRHGFRDSDTHQISVKLTLNLTSATLEFIDDGEPFDPTVEQNSVKSSRQTNAAHGGRGLAFVNALIDGFQYKRLDKRNHTVLTKRFEIKENSHNA